MNKRTALSIVVIAATSLLVLSACKSNQTQQQSSSMPSSSGSPSSSSGSPSSGSQSSSSSPSSRSGSTASTSSSRSGGLPSTPGGGPSSGLPSPGLPSPGFPSSGTPGSSMPGSPSTETGQSSGSQSGQSGQTAGGRSGSPGDESPFPAEDANGDGIPDTAQPGQNANNDVDFSEQSSGGSASSREEQISTLDQELEGSMRDYDGKILEERAGVMGRANDAGAEGQLEDFDRSVAYYDEGDKEAGGSEEVSMDEQIPGSQNKGNPGTPSGLPTSGRSKDVTTAPPDDIPSGNDDDVVARQIREAAMKERDPDLREALWEEYRKYKNQ